MDDLIKMNKSFRHENVILALFFKNQAMIEELRYTIGIHVKQETPKGINTSKILGWSSFNLISNH